MSLITARELYSLDNLSLISNLKVEIEIGLIILRHVGMVCEV